MFPEYTNPDHDIIPNRNIPNGLYQIPSVRAPGSEVHDKDSQENDVRDNVMVGIDVDQETCIRDKDMDPP